VKQEETSIDSDAIKKKLGGRCRKAPTYC